MGPLKGLPEWMKQRQAPANGHAPRRGFIEKNLSSFTAFLNGALSERHSKLPGLLQKVEPGARIYGMLALVFTGAAASRASVLAVLCVITVALAVLSKVGLWELAKRVLPAFIFTTALVAPVSFSFITPGTELWGAGGGGFRLSVTREGAQAALFFILRVVSMVSPVSLLMMTTAQAEFFRGLGKLPVPAFFKTAVFMTFRYVFILLKAAEDASLARRSRTITRPRLAESQGWFASRAAFLLKKSLTTAEEVTMAMSSRGFSGRIRTFESARMRGRDLLWLGFASFVFFMSLGI